ncbi:MAG: hypothetical protein IJR87_01980 [Bacteroidaceae bacterium]|nr:hypothetical protein [Bacteroidaceae bacterium]
MKPFFTKLCMFCLLGASTLTVNAQQRYVNYRYAPQGHVSTTAFPDDRYKTIVGPQGQLLYEFGGGKFFPYIGDGFKTAIHMMADENQMFEPDRLLSARIPVVVIPSLLEGGKVEQFIYSTTKNLTEGREIVNPLASDREDIILTKVHNSSDKPRTVHPVVYINSEHKVAVKGNVVTIDSTKHFVMSLPVIRVRQNMTDFKTCVELQPQDVPAGGEISIVGLYDNGLSSELAARLTNAPAETVKEIPANYEAVCDYWKNRSPVPYGHINVPDREIQNLIDASVRGIWQAREIINGNISLQVGPTCYRGLWITDGAFISETSALLGAGVDARAGIEYSLSFQNPEGGFIKLTPVYWKESGQILWTCVRHAMLTQDKEWLLSKWPVLTRTVEYIKLLRQRSYENAFPEDDGLMPPGFIDGGLVGGEGFPEYSNILWNLTGMKAFISAADWLGKRDDAKKWQREYDDFYATFKKAAARDIATDDFGNRYLNDIMKPEQRSLPQRAQWAFCQSIYPGQVFEPGDSIAVGTMRMLDCTLQEGMVMGTGWIIDGIWNYFASFYGHAWLWNGEGDKAANALYAFANHASPLYNWREEHNPRDMHPSYVGDMPHNWASAEFIRLACHLLQIDRGTELHLLEGVPQEWLGAGMETSLKEIATPFGPLTMSLSVDQDGEWADLTVEPLSKNCTAIVVHTGQWGRTGNKNIIKLKPNRQNKLRIKIGNV